LIETKQRTFSVSNHNYNFRFGVLINFIIKQEEMYSLNFLLKDSTRKMEA